MIKNFTKFIKNPNSPEAIEARRNGLEDPTSPESTQIIFDENASSIIVDRSNNTVTQRASGTFLGGNQFSKKLIRSSLITLKNGKNLLVSYFFDTKKLQWIITKDYVEKSLPDPSSPGSPEIPVPRPTYGGTYGGFFSSAPGENWRNENRSMDSIKDAEKRVYKSTPIDPTADRSTDQPDGELTDSTPLEK